MMRAAKRRATGVGWPNLRISLATWLNWTQQMVTADQGRRIGQQQPLGTETLGLT